MAMMPVSAGLGSFLEELDSDKFENLVSRVNPSGTSVSFVVKIPKFAISFDSGDDVLKDALISMGMETAFSPAADYSGIYKDGNAHADEHRYEILQKCTVNVGSSLQSGRTVPVPCYFWEQKACKAAFAADAKTKKRHHRLGTTKGRDRCTSRRGRDISDIDLNRL